MADISNIFDEMVSSERLFEAWYEFKKGKAARYDVQEFGRHAEKHIFKLRRELISGTYRHSPYESFFVHDPKRRHIRKASVRDRLVHHTLHMTLGKWGRYCAECLSQPGSVRNSS
jgi:RNA-directed DNA polymerase